MERMLSAASATKSSFESEFGSALEAKNAELKESTMAVQVCVNSSSAPCPCKSWELGRFQQLLLALAVEPFQGGKAGGPEGGRRCFGRVKPELEVGWSRRGLHHDPRDGRVRGR